MWTEYYDIDLIGKGKENVCASLINLYIRFYADLTEYDGESFYEGILQWTDENIIKPMDDMWMVFGAIDYRSISSKKYYEYCLKELNKNGTLSFCFDAIRKNDQISSKRKYELYREQCFSEDACFERDNTANPVFDHGQQGKALFEEIISAEGKFLEPAYGLFDAQFSVEINAPVDNIVHGEIELGLSVAALGNRIDEQADCLKGMLCEFCTMYRESYGYVCLCNDSLSNNDEARLFEDYDDGIAIDKKNKNEVSVLQYLDYNYIDSLEWYNVIPIRMISNCDMSVLSRIKNDVFETNCNGTHVHIGSNCDILKHRRMYYKDIYSLLDDCFRPGYSVYSLNFSETDSDKLSDDSSTCNECFTYGLSEYEFLRPRYEDIYVPENWYKIKDNNIYFNRGSFEFLTYRYTDED